MARVAVLTIIITAQVEAVSSITSRWTAAVIQTRSSHPRVTLEAQSPRIRTTTIRIYPSSLSSNNTTCSSSSSSYASSKTPSQVAKQLPTSTPSSQSPHRLPQMGRPVRLVRPLSSHSSSSSTTEAVVLTITTQLTWAAATLRRWTRQG